MRVSQYSAASLSIDAYLRMACLGISNRQDLFLQGCHTLIEQEFVRVVCETEVNTSSDPMACD